MLVRGNVLEWLGVLRTQLELSPPQTPLKRSFCHREDMVTGLEAMVAGVEAMVAGLGRVVD